MLTVVIPTANNPIDLGILLVQLQCQTKLPDQIYLADNSKDGYGLELAKRYQFKVPIYVDQNPGKIYKSWNEGMKFSKSDVLILNDDLLIGETFIEDILENDDRKTVICPAGPGFPPVFQVRPDYYWKRKFYPEYTIKNVSENIYVPTMKGWAFFVPLSISQKIGIFDEQFDIWYGDRDYENRILQAGFKLGFVRTNVSHYGTSSYSKIDKKVFNKTNLTDQIKYEEKNGIKHEDLGWG